MPSIFCVSSFAACALALCVACSEVGTQTGARIDAANAPAEGVSAAADVPAPASIEPAAAIEVAANPVAAVTRPAVDARPARPSPMQALEQMVTAQALLVSLLLTPLSKDAADQTVARADAPRGAMSAPVR